MIAPNFLANSAAAVAVLALSLPSPSAMKRNKRILLVCAPNEGDSSLSEQRRIVAYWKKGAEERELIVVEVVGER